jgi:hypothetical protein
MPSEDFEPKHQTYSLRNNPLSHELAVQIRGDFLLYALCIDRQVYFRKSPKDLFSRKGGLLAVIRVPYSENYLRVPFGQEKPPILDHMEWNEKVGTVFIPKFVICNLGSLTQDDLYFADFPTIQATVDHLNRYSKRRLDNSSLVSVYYIRGFNVKDEAEVPDGPIFLPLGSPSQPTRSYEPPPRRQTVGQLMWGRRRRRW